MNEPGCRPGGPITTITWNLSQALPPERKTLISSGEFYLRYLMLRFNTVHGLNRHIGGSYRALTEVPYERSGKLTGIYDDFVKTYLPLRLLRIRRNETTVSLWRDFLNKNVPQQAERLPFFTTVPVDPGARILWGKLSQGASSRHGGGDPWSGGTVPWDFSAAGTERWKTLRPHGGPPAPPSRKFRFH